MLILDSNFYRQEKYLFKLIKNNEFLEMLFKFADLDYKPSNLTTIISKNYIEVIFENIDNLQEFLSFYNKVPLLIKSFNQLSLNRFHLTFSKQVLLNKIFLFKKFDNVTSLKNDILSKVKNIKTFPDFNSAKNNLLTYCNSSIQDAELNYLIKSFCEYVSEIYCLKQKSILIPKSYLMNIQKIEDNILTYLNLNSLEISQKIRIKDYIEKVKYSVFMANNMIVK